MLPLVSIIPAFVINLDADKDRYERVKRQLDRQGLMATRVPAVDAKDKSLHQQFKKSAKPMCRLLCTNVMIAIYLSHRKIWSYMVENRIQRAMIFEDDIELRSVDLERDVNHLIDHCPLDMDILLLGCFFCRYKNNDYLSQIILKLSAQKKKEVEINDWIYKPMSWTGAHAYVLTLHGAEKLLSGLPSASFHVDVMMRNSTLKTYASKIPLVMQNTSGKGITSNTTGEFEYLSNWKIDHGTMGLSFMTNGALFEVFGIYVTLYRLILSILIISILFSVRHVKKSYIHLK